MSSLGIAFPIRKSRIQIWYSLQYLSIAEAWNDLQWLKGTCFVSLWWHPEDICSPYFLLHPQSGLICYADVSSWTDDSENLHHISPHNVFIPYNDCEVGVGHKIARKQKVHVAAKREPGEGKLDYYRSEAWGYNTGIWTRGPWQLNSEFWFFSLKLHKHTHIQGLCFCDGLTLSGCNVATKLLSHYSSSQGLGVGRKCHEKTHSLR